MDSQSPSFTCNHDLSFSLPGPNRSARFPAVSILYRKTLLIYAHLCSCMVTLWPSMSTLWRILRVICRHLSLQSLAYCTILVSSKSGEDQGFVASGGDAARIFSPQPLGCRERDSRAQAKIRTWSARADGGLSRERRLAISPAHGIVPGLPLPLKFFASISWNDCG